MRDRLAKSIIVLLVVFLSEASFAAPGIEARPRIALVISGGGLRALAVIGVYKVLVELGYPLDLVGGVSMGSIMGVLIANRYHPDDLEKLVLNFDWEVMFNGAASRQHLHMAEKARDAQYLLSLPRLDLPGGFWEGQAIAKELCLLTSSFHGTDDFSKFPIPFFCVATDLATLKPVVLDKGFVVEAVRASMAIAILFTPVRMNGQVLADGAMSDNLPTEEARKRGADYVICVDVGAPLRDSENLDSLVDILMQIMKRDAKSKTQQHASCDLLIAPEVQEFGHTDFDKIPEIIKRGEQAARIAFQSRGEVGALAATKPQQFNRVPTRQDTISVVGIDFTGLQTNEREFVAAQFGLVPPCRVTLGQLEGAIDRVYGLKLFERVAYQLKNTGNGVHVTVRLAEKNSSSFRFGVNYQSDHGASLLFNVTRRKLSGSRLSVDLRFGHVQQLEAEYLTPLLQNWKTGLKLRANYTGTFIPKYEGARRAEEYRHRAMAGEVSAGTFFSRTNELAIGMRAESNYLDPHVASLQSTRTQNANLIPFGKWQIDTFDRTVYPHKGFFISCKSEKIYETGKSMNFTNAGWRHSFEGRAYVPIRARLAMMARAQLGRTESSAPPLYRQFFLGGVDSFAGWNANELRGAQMLAVQTGLQYEAWHKKFLIVRWNFGKTSSEWHQLFMKRAFISGGAVTLGWSTLFGPIEATVAHGDRHGLQMHCNFGYKF